MSLRDYPTEEMPAPSCTPDGACKECGEIITHKGTCSWSLMRSGTIWIPTAWLTSAHNTGMRPEK